MGQDIFSIASKHADWVGRGRHLTATNVSNLNSPGFKAQSIAPFETMLQNSLPQAQPLATHARHMTMAPSAAEIGVTEDENRNTLHSGNSVDLDKELLKTGEFARAHTLNNAVVRSFHRMVLMSTKVGS